MNHQEFIDKYNGKFVERGGSANAKNQCVDLVNAYIEEVLGIPKLLWTNARDFDDRLLQYFDIYENTPDFVPLQRDIAIWEHDDTGHIGIVNTANLKTFTSFDQNWPLKSPSHLVKHSYTNPPVAKFMRIKPEYDPLVINKNQSDSEAFDEVVGSKNTYKIVEEWFRIRNRDLNEGNLRELLDKADRFDSLMTDKQNADVENREIREDLQVAKESARILAENLTKLRLELSQCREDMNGMKIPVIEEKDESMAGYQNVEQSANEGGDIMENIFSKWKKMGISAARVFVGTFVSVFGVALFTQLSAGVDLNNWQPFLFAVISSAGAAAFTALGKYIRETYGQQDYSSLIYKITP